MFSYILKFKRWARRLLKVQSESRQAIQPATRRRSAKILLLVGFSVLVSIIYPGEALYDPLDMPRKNENALEDIIAPFQITVYKSIRELNDEREVVRSAVPMVVDSDTAISGSAFAALKRFFSLVDSVRHSPGWADALKRQQYLQPISTRFPLLSESAIEQSLTIDSLWRVHRYLKTIYEDDLYKVGVLASKKSLPDSRNKSVLVRKGERENIYSRDRLLDMPTANGRLLTSLNHLYSSDSIDVEYYYLIGRTFIQPDLRVNMQAYNRRVEQELTLISEIKEVVNTGDIIVRSGRKVSPRQEQVLQEMARILRGQAAESGWLVPLLPALARVVMVLAVFTLLYLFLYYFRGEIYRSTPKLVAIFFAFALQLALIHLITRWELSVYLYPVALLPILITILFDAEVGILSTIILALLLGMLHRFDFTVTLMTVVVGMVACFTSREVRRRTHFFRIIFFTVIAYAVFILVVESLKLRPVSDIWTEVGYGLVNGIISSFLVIGVIPFFESLFGITTDITLLELSDMNHPLLKRLAIEAPGTYHHSIVVGNLSEAAAKAIGGNSLLARVGAYYHDIGKIEIPEYFVENQLGIKSKHEMLTPSMSSIILSSHVKKGRMLGEIHDIPDDVLNFIEEHHGTMVMSYFYNKALQEGADESTADKFRYPGPRPLTRETGIAMLADAVEAASRTLDDPKPARINNLIQRIIDDRFKSGELDLCPLTLRDLAKIKEAFSQILVGIFHHRIAYPKKEDAED